MYKRKRSIAEKSLTQTVLLAMPPVQFLDVALIGKDRTEIVVPRNGLLVKRKDVLLRFLSSRPGISDWLFHRPALSIGQKTEFSFLRVFVELLQLHFH